MCMFVPGFAWPAEHNPKMAVAAEQATGPDTDVTGCLRKHACSVISRVPCFTTHPLGVRTVGLSLQAAWATNGQCNELSSCSNADE
jgi:hypothetical protein